MSNRDSWTLRALQLLAGFDSFKMATKDNATNMHVMVGSLCVGHTDPDPAKAARVTLQKVLEEADKVIAKLEEPVKAARAERAKVAALLAEAPND